MFLLFKGPEPWFSDNSNSPVVIKKIPSFYFSCFNHFQESAWCNSHFNNKIYIYIYILEPFKNDSFPFKLSYLKLMSRWKPSKQQGGVQFGFLGWSAANWVTLGLRLLRQTFGLADIYCTCACYYVALWRRSNWYSVLLKISWWQVSMDYTQPLNRHALCLAYLHSLSVPWFRVQLF